jgi:chromosome segregation ATPase
MKLLLPWLFVIGLLGGVVFLVSSNHKLTNEVTELREASNQMQALHAELEQIKTTGSPAQAEQIARLSKDNQDLPKLRKEVHQLREDKKLLGQQAQTAQAQVQAAQSHIATLSTDLQSAQAGAQQQVLATHQQESANACLNNLRQLDGAKQQWALEGNKTARDIPTEKDLAPYLKDGLPKCPDGGTYTIMAADTVPFCSVPGHAMPQ